MTQKLAKQEGAELEMVIRETVRKLWKVTEEGDVKRAEAGGSSCFGLL